MKRSSLLFTAPHEVCLQPEELPIPGPGQLLVQAKLSAISAGTELLVYRGQFPTGLAVDASLPGFSGEFAYPLKYGYSLAGQVAAAGEGMDPTWSGRRVFAFHPHESHFLASPSELIPIPDGISLEDAVLLPNMETAVNLVLDGGPLIGERVIVFGQGMVGLLTTALLARFPLGDLVSVDRYSSRQEASLAAGAQASFSPEQLNAILERFPGGADLVFELSGAPEALDAAIRVTGFAGRVVIGSWYGKKRLSLDLGGEFHRSRMRLISSQVSTLAPELSGRWTKERRFALAWEMLRQIRPSRWVTHRIPLSRAAEAYRLLDRQPEIAIQVLFTYQEWDR